MLLTRNPVCAAFRDFKVAGSDQKGKAVVQTGKNKGETLDSQSAASYSVQHLHAIRPAPHLAAT